MVVSQHLRFNLARLLLAGLTLAGCASPPGNSGDARYFDTPQAVVPVVTEWLRQEDWRTLACYYDLKGSAVSRWELETGRFFLRAERPPVAHPGVAWRIREPFQPGFKFDHVEPAARPGVVRVVVALAIDEGDGMTQRAVASFLLRRSSHGYQLLPNPKPSS